MVELLLSHSEVAAVQSRCKAWTSGKVAIVRFLMVSTSMMVGDTFCTSWRRECQARFGCNLTCWFESRWLKGRAVQWRCVLCACVLPQRRSGNALGRWIEPETQTLSKGEPDAGSKAGQDYAGARLVEPVDTPPPSPFHEPGFATARPSVVMRRNLSTSPRDSMCA